MRWGLLAAGLWITSSVAHASMVPQQECTSYSIQPAFYGVTCACTETSGYGDPPPRCTACHAAPADGGGSTVVCDQFTDSGGCSSAPLDVMSLLVLVAVLRRRRT
jgi:hypothetical protein